MTTIILNDGPYGTERSYNGLRLALGLIKKEEKLQIFLMGDAVQCAVKDQRTPAGYYNIGRMVKGLLKRDVKVYA